MPGDLPPGSVRPDVDHPSVFRALFKAYPDALLLVDATGQIVMANPMASDLLGYAPDELVGLPVEALVPDAIRPRHAAYRAAYGVNPRPRPMGTQMELVAKRRDGSEVMVEIALSPLHGEGLPYVVAAIRGIGAYPRVKQALQRARYSEHVAQMGRLAVDTRDPQLLLQQVPAVAVNGLEADLCAIFLLEPDRLAFRVASGIGLLDEEHVGARVPNLPDTPLGYVLNAGRPVVIENYAAEQRFSVPDAYLRAGLVSAVAVPLSDRGRAIGVLTVRSRRAQTFGDDEIRFVESLANLVASALQRAQSEEALQHAQRLESVGQLTGGIAHDFNNLLTIIQGNLQVLEEHPAVEGDAYAQQLVAAAARASRRGAELTGKLLAFSRRQVLRPSRVDVVTMLQSLADMLRRTLDQRVRIEVDAAPDCPPCLADPGQLESALLNIAINARDAMPEGGLISFSCRPCETLPAAALSDLDTDAAPMHAFVAIAISDTGTGMPDAVKERAFEPFFTTKEPGRGTGLGLSTVYGFVKQSHGAILIDSALGAGTTVTLYIPRYQERQAAGSGDESGAGLLPPGLKVLLVEDEPEVRAVAQAFLQGLGCRVIACANAEQALVRLGTEPELDALLSDVALGPGMRGTELVRQVRARRPKLAVLLMSGYSSELAQADVSDPGLRCELLPKPFTKAALAQALARALAAVRAG
ncbi:GAF domain-containing protein [Caldimonas thermodepolymerans]|uniref:GAF domain-containing protein n=1 Tax=Caldimonas thermodepolymerans TaxID=215580 RepID=UPI0022367DBD|nr:GAF domain-containing protein [Caldimonas thermodepolymerans]UZG42668.1 GAF domain-containing protein [Caldimonas thermodepolymerans]